ncbi:hypothetical protein ACFPN2_08430 [Steroidobacter flavus]|uniref:Uncharacterized protein n=1 Tax=Steroidobacter flavus TaxID=1842136 RepID=A0ABV8SQF2_9GAMM
MPQRVFKLWTSYRLPTEGWSRGLTFSGGVQGQSNAFQAGTACTEFNPLERGAERR